MTQSIMRMAQESVPEETKPLVDVRELGRCGVCNQCRQGYQLRDNYGTLLIHCRYRNEMVSPVPHVKQCAFYCAVC